MDRFSGSDIKKLELMKSDIDYTKATGVEPVRGLKPRIRSLYLRLQDTPIVGKLMKILLGTYRSYWTSQQVLTLEAELANLKERIRILENER